MSWPLASFLIVGLVLGIGWLAYERRCPSARMAAVVGVMAALAALGRDAFAALPDVKPITAMTLVVGYALGPLPGFTVGALGMLVSNFMLGQGPYTPWQMAAWGIVGLAGALLGRLSRRSLGRVSLALACGLAALGAKEVMNLYTWTLGASHTPAAFLAVAGSALSYDVTDTIASFLFGLAFAPELAQVLARIKVRMEVTWVEPAVSPPDGRSPGRRPSLTVASSLLALLGAATLLLAAGQPPRAGAQTDTHPRRPLAHDAGAASARVSLAGELSYLAGAQNRDGGFGGARGQSSSELYSGWVAMGLAAAGRDPLAVRRSGHSVLDALHAEAGGLQGAGDLERTILALHACGVSVRSLPGGDPVARLLRLRSPNGSFGGLSNLTAFAVFALRAAGYPAGSPLVSRAGRWLSRQQNGDGGFGFATRGGSSDVDDTAAVLQALVDAGMRGSPLAHTAGFLIAAQNRDGGFPQQPGGESNAQSTAWAIQGLTAAGRNVAGVRHVASRSPIEYLLGLIASDGSVRYSRTGTQTPVWVTAQATAALAGKTLPIAPVAHRAAVAASTPAAPAPTGAPRAAPAPRPSPQRPARPRPGARSASGAPRTSGVGADRLDGLARAMGALLGAVLGPLLR